MPALQWAVVVADLDAVRGSDQRGRRPVLVVSNEEFNQATTNVTVLPLTSTPRRLYPSEVLLLQGQAGQPRESIILAHQVRTIARERLRNVFGYLEDPALRRLVQDAVREHLDLE